jgi:hypothetical protein
MRRFLFGRPGTEVKAIRKTVDPSQNVWDRHIFIFALNRHIGFISIFCLPEPPAIYYADHHRRQAQCRRLVLGLFAVSLLSMVGAGSLMRTKTTGNAISSNLTNC